VCSLQRTGMGQADSKQCFQDSDVNASPVRKKLYACVVCKVSVGFLPCQQHRGPVLAL
jgi:hypothetical protein